MAELLRRTRRAPSVPVPAPGVRTPAWDLLLGCIAVYIATSIGRVHQLFPVLGLVKPALLATLLAVGLYLLQQFGQRRMGLLRSPMTTCMLSLLAWGALSVPFALNQGVAFQFWTDFARTVLMALVVAGSVRGAHDLKRLTFVYFAVTVLYTAVVLVRFQLSADSWRLGRLYNYDANDLATLIASAMPLGLYFVLGHRRLALRIVAIAGLGVLLVGMIRSGSRGGFIALLAVVAFVLLGFTTIPARARVAGLAAILAVVFGAASDKYWSQMQTMLNPNQDYNLTSDAGRMKIWERGLGYMAAHPVLGVGGQNFGVAEGTISPLARLQERSIGVRWGAAHNTFIQVGAELGIPGLLLFIGLIGTAFRSLRRVTRHWARAGGGSTGVDLSRLAQALMAALIGFLVGSFFLSLAYSDILYTLLAFTIALAKIARVANAQPASLPRVARI